MGHYEELGVAPDATMTEIRAAYLRAARLWHPDVAGPEGVARMQRVNEAWAVLSHAGSRAAYDRGQGGGPARPSTFVADPSGGIEEDEEDRATYYRPVGGLRALTMAPPILFAGAVGSGVLGVVLRLAAFGVIAVLLLGLSVAAFLAAPLLVMGGARRAERTAPRGDGAAGRTGR